MSYDANKTLLEFLRDLIAEGKRFDNGASTREEILEVIKWLLAEGDGRRLAATFTVMTAHLALNTPLREAFIANVAKTVEIIPLEMRTKLDEIMGDDFEKSTEKSEKRRKVKWQRI